MTATVPILCFAGGDVRLAIAVADVLALRDDDGDAPALAAALGLDDHADGPRRALTLASPRGPVTVAIHGPIAVHQLAVEHIVRAPAGVALAPLVLGFARVGGELVQLLEVERVVAGLMPPGAS